MLGANGGNQTRIAKTRRGLAAAEALPGTAIGVETQLFKGPDCGLLKPQYISQISVLAIV